jgi:hypothetical protein
VAPFFGDVDTRAAASNVVTFGQTVTLDGHKAFCVDWAGVSGVGYYNEHTDKLNSFQLLLIDRSDVGAGDFDIEMNYDKVQWETGDASAAAAASAAPRRGWAGRTATRRAPTSTRVRASTAPSSTRARRASSTAASARATSAATSSPSAAGA